MLTLQEIYITKYQENPNDPIYKYAWEKGTPGSKAPTLSPTMSLDGELSLFNNNPQININNCYRLKDWQKTAINKIRSGKDLFINGSPGAGKTTPYICLWMQYFLKINVIENKVTPEQALEFLQNLVNLFYIEKLSSLQKLLILVPTRTLAKQTYDEFIARFANIMCQAMNVSMATIYSSEVRTKINEDINKIKQYYTLILNQVDSIFNKIKAEGKRIDNHLSFFDGIKNNIPSLNLNYNNPHNSFAKDYSKKILTDINKYETEFKNSSKKIKSIISKNEDLIKELKEASKTEVNFDFINSITSQIYYYSQIGHLLYIITEILKECANTSLYIINYIIGNINLSNIYDNAQFDMNMAKNFDNKYNEIKDKLNKFYISSSKYANLENFSNQPYNIENYFDRSFNELENLLQDIHNSNSEIERLIGNNTALPPSTTQFPPLRIEPIAKLNMPDLPDEKSISVYEFWSTGKGSFLDLFLKLFDSKSNPGVNGVLNLGVISNSLNKIKTLHNKYISKHNRPIPANLTVRLFKKDIELIMSNNQVEAALSNYIRNLICLRTGTMKEKDPESTLVTISIYQGSDKITSSSLYRKFGLLVCDEAQELTMLASASDNEVEAVRDRARALYKVISMLPPTTRIVLLSGTTNNSTAIELCNYLNKCKKRNFDIPLVTSDRNASNIAVIGDNNLRNEKDFLNILKNQIVSDNGSLVILFSKKKIIHFAVELGKMLGRREFSQVKIDINDNPIFNNNFINSADKYFGKKNESFGKRISANILASDKNAIKDILYIEDPFLRNCALAGFGYIYSVKDDDPNMTRQKVQSLQKDFNIVSGLFEAGKIKLMISTSAVGVGVNMKVKRMYIPNTTFGGNTLSLGSMSQLLNRAGRGDYPISTIYTTPENIDLIKSALNAKNSDYDKGYVIRDSLFNGLMC